MTAGEHLFPLNLISLIKSELVYVCVRALVCVYTSVRLNMSRLLNCSFKAWKICRDEVSRIIATSKNNNKIQDMYLY